MSSHKIHIRTLFGDDFKPLWVGHDQRESLRQYLNDQGFYVLTGAGDALEVYALEYFDPLDVQLAKKALDKLAKLWHTWKTKKEKIK